MKYVILTIMLSAVLLTGCYSNNLKVTNHFKAADLLKTAQNQASKRNEPVVITDIKAWNHPTKKYLESKGLTLIKVELLKNKTYPVFYLASCSDDILTDSIFLTDLAEKNGFWDYKIVAGKKYTGVTVDKEHKVITKINSNIESLDIRHFNFSKFQGEWLDLSYAHSDGEYSKVSLEFKSNSNLSAATFKSCTSDMGNAAAKTKLFFDCFGQSKFLFTDDKGNKISGEISLMDNSVDVAINKYIKIADKRNIFTTGFGSYVRQDKFNNVKKAFTLLVKEYGFEDQHKGTYIPKTDDDSVYLNFEGITDDGRYRIAVRRCKDTVICAWYLVNINTGDIEIEN